LIGYCDISPIQPIPDTSAFRTISRIQTTMSPAKLKRLLNRGTISIENVKKYKAKMFQKGLNSPYLELESASSGHKYRRYIAFGELVDQPSDGTFDHFGLSKTATIPWF
jgi:CRISPR-associated endonuclease Csy4